MASWFRPQPVLCGESLVPFGVGVTVKTVTGGRENIWRESRRVATGSQEASIVRTQVENEDEADRAEIK